MSERSFRVVLWSLALTGLLVDQATKYSVFAWLQEVDGHKYSLFEVKGQPPPGMNDPHEYPGFHLRAQFEQTEDGRMVPHVNQGALFGLLRDQKSAANMGFAVISLLAAVAIVFWSFQKTTAADIWLCASLGLILAGTLGNFYDRIVFNGVRDFLHWNYLFDWPVFNFADCCLVCGAGLLLVQAFATAPVDKTDNQPTALMSASPKV